MAALLRHGALKTARIGAKTHVPSAGFATKAEKKKGMDRKQPPRIESTAEAIAAKGFLRPHRPYAPPADVANRLDGVFRKVLGGGVEFADLDQKFQVCAGCAKEFGHAVPNSLLHTIRTLDDVVRFYETPVDTVTPLDRMRGMELPENLHVQFEYHRFRPDTDKMFGGQTAFNRSSTIVTGLKYKGKYQGHVQKQTWPFNS